MTGIAAGLLIFDFDGTLCDTRAAIAHCLRQAFARHGLPAPAAADIDGTIRSGGVMADAIRVLRPDIATDPQRVEELVAAYRDIYDSGEGLTHTRLFDGAEPVLAALAKQGFVLAVVSNKGERSVTEALRHFGILAHFAMVVGNRPEIERKPHPDSYRKAILPHFAGQAPLRVVVIGDSVPDLLYARAIGAVSCWAMYGFGDRVACEALNPDLRITALAALPKALSGSASASAGND